MKVSTLVTLGAMSTAVAGYSLPANVKKLYDDHKVSIR